MLIDERALKKQLYVHCLDNQEVFFDREIRIEE